MARVKKSAVSSPSQVKPQNDQEAIYPNGAFFGVVQLERDLSPVPAAQRITQLVNRNGELKCYITENAYEKSELKGWFDKMFRDSYGSSIPMGAPCLYPVKGKIHWLRFDLDAVLGNPSKRINPETDEEEKPEY